MNNDTLWIEPSLGQETYVGTMMYGKELEKNLVLDVVIPDIDQDRLEDGVSQTLGERPD